MTGQVDQQLPRPDDATIPQNRDRAQQRTRIPASVERARVRDGERRACRDGSETSRWQRFRVVAVRDGHALCRRKLPAIAKIHRHRLGVGHESIAVPHHQLFEQLLQPVTRAALQVRREPRPSRPGIAEVRDPGQPRDPLERQPHEVRRMRRAARVKDRRFLPSNDLPAGPDRRQTPANGVIRRGHPELDPVTEPAER